MKRLLIFLAVLFMLIGNVEAATYCLRNDGTAGSKTAATDCLTVGNCMNETVHNGQTFSASDVILVCPHGGAFDLQVTTPSNGGSGTEIRYAGQYSTTYGWPIFGEGFKLATNYIIAYGMEVRPGIAESGTKVYEGIRIADTSRSWQAAEETPVDDWESTTKFIVAAGIGATGGGLSVTPEIRWRDKTDAGAWTALAASGELKYGDCTALTDEANLAVGNFGTSSGKTKVEGVKCEQENSAIAGGSTTLATEQYTELQACFDPAGADDGHEYEYGLFETATQIGSASPATVTICKPASTDSTVKFFWRGEGIDLSGGVDDYSAGDNSANAQSGATITSTRVKMGNNSLDFELDGCVANGGEAYDFNDSLDNIFDGETGTFGFWWNKDCDGSETSLLYINETTSGNYIIARQWYGDLRLYHNDGVGEEYCTTGSVSNDTWYWIEVRVDAAADEARLLIFNDTTPITYKGGCTISSGIDDITPSGGLDKIKFGNFQDASAKYGDQFIDHMVITNTYAPTWKYSNDPTYSTCVAE